MHASKIFFPLLLLAAGLWLGSGLFPGAWFTSHDGLYHLQRLISYREMLLTGHFPVRWASTLDYGRGLPLFNYLYPAPYLIGSLLSFFFAPHLALKLTYLLAYLLGGFGIYSLIKPSGRLVGFTAALVFLTLPYQLVNLYVRGALGEVFVLGVAPWVLISFADLDKQRFRWYHPLPVALLLLSHNFLGFAILAFLTLYQFVTRKFSRAHLLALASGIFLASFFWLPMLMERQYLASVSTTDFTFTFHEHFIYMRQLISPVWGYGYSLIGPFDELSFSLGLVSLLTVGTALFLLLRRGKNRQLLVFLLTAYLFVVFLTNNRSQFLWNNLPLLAVIQFPWRFLLFTVLLTPLIFWQLLTVFPLPRQALRIFCVILILLSLTSAYSRRLPSYRLSEQELTGLLTVNYGHQTTAARTELLPKWALTSKSFPESSSLIIEPLNFPTSLEESPGELSFTYEAVAGEKLTVRYNYFPSWQLTIDGQPAGPLTPGPRGNIVIPTMQGVHTYHLSVGTTSLEKLANLLSLFTILALGSYAVKSRRQ